MSNYAILNHDVRFYSYEISYIRRSEFSVGLVLYSTLLVRVSQHLLGKGKNALNGALEKMY